MENFGLSQELLKDGIDLLQHPRSITTAQGIVELGAQVQVSNGRVSLAETFADERGIAENIMRLVQVNNIRPVQVSNIFEPGFTPHEVQLEAVELIGSSTVSVLTGGPGTGKTTLLRAMLYAFKRERLRVICMAPTGKAAQRMAEQTGSAAGTIHRTLGGMPPFSVNASQPIEADVVVIDETSMVDVSLAYAAISAVRTGARLLIVGDVDQLPSIGPGRVLFDLIVSGVIPCVRLTKIFRQASESRIPWVARDINNGSVPSDLAGEGTDFRFITKEDATAAADLIVAAVSKHIPAQKGYKPHEIQVLAAQKGGRTDAAQALGVEQLNFRLQTAINPAEHNEGDVFIGAGYSCRKGDKVIHTKNNYDLEVMNGEVGFVLDADPQGLDLHSLEGDIWTSSMGAERRRNDDDDDVDSDDEDALARRQAALERLGVRSSGSQSHVLVVQYGGRQVAYTYKEARELQLAYAITVHKSQGSQFKAVVIPVHSAHQYMLTRPLVYTAVTRAEEYVLCVGTSEALAKAARNTRGTDRDTRLQQLLRDAEAPPALPPSDFDPQAALEPAPKAVPAPRPLNGAPYSRCIYCSRQLTVPEHKERGYGPECAKRHVPSL